MKFFVYIYPCVLVFVGHGCAMKNRMVAVSFDSSFRRQLSLTSTCCNPLTIHIQTSLSFQGLYPQGNKPPISTGIESDVQGYDIPSLFRLYHMTTLPSPP